VTTIERVTEDHPDLVALATAMVEEMIGLYGGDVGTWKLVPERGEWLVLRDDDGTAVACAGLIPLDVAVPGSSAHLGELKRVFVLPAARGRGLSRVIVDAAVALAPSLGYSELWLETGDLQPVAVGLYDRMGWRRIPPYGPYADVHSICFSLTLEDAT